MVQIDIPAAFAASMFFVDLGRQRLQEEAHRSAPAKPGVYYQYLYRAVFFAGFVIAPAGIYLLAGWPGWEQIYWSRRYEQVMHTGWGNALLPAAFVMAIVLGGYLGHVLGYRWLVAGKERYVRPTYLIVLAAVAVVVLAYYPSFLLVGTYDQYHNLNGQTRESMAHVWTNPYGFSVAWLGVMAYFSLATVFVVGRVLSETRACRGVRSSSVAPEAGGSACPPRS
jgi:MFS family permease